MFARQFPKLVRNFLFDKQRAEIADESIARKILIAPVSTVADLPDDRQLSFRKFFTSLHHLGNPLPFPGAPYCMSESAWQLNELPPSPGAHNEKYLKDLSAAEKA